MIDTGNTGNWVTVTPDDRQVVFVSLRTGLPAVWTVSLDGGMPAQLFDALDFAWSRDGKRLAIARSVTTNDIVLFKGLRH